MALIIIALVVVAVVVALWPKQEEQQDRVDPYWRELEETDDKAQIIGSYGDDNPTMAFRRAPEPKE